MYVTLSIMIKIQLNKTITNENSENYRSIKIIILILSLIVFSSGLIFESGNPISIIYYSFISLSVLISFFIKSKWFKVSTFLIFIIGAILGTEYFGLEMEQYEEFYIVIPVICLIIFPGNLYIILICTILATTYFLHPGDEDILGIIEDATELIVISSLVTIVSYQYEKIKKQMLLFKYNSYHDQLTTLPNKEALKEFFKTIKNVKECNLILIEIDNIKSITNFNGLEFSEKVIKLISTKLSKIMNEDIKLYRVNLNEFAIISCNNSRITPLIKRIFEEFSQKTTIDNISVNLKISIGFSGVENRDTTFENLLRNCDIALHQAQKSPISNYIEYREELGKNFNCRMKKIRELREAIDKKDFVVHYQPKNRVEDKSIVGFEALVRWDHNKRGVIYPDSFINLAEETGMIIEIGYHVLREVCGFIVKMINNGFNPVKVSVNISPYQLQDPELCRNILKILDQSGVKSNFIELEITEGALMVNPDYSIKILNELRSYGFSVAIDDFGVGYSSFSYVKDLPINTLKLDKLFVKDILKCKKSLMILRAMINMSSALNLHILAEGVENQEQLDILKELGCDSFQGFLISKPVSERDVASLL